MLPAAYLTVNRTHANRSLVDTCSIYNITPTPTNRGRSTNTTARATGVACRYVALSGRELERAAGIASEADCVVTLPAQTAVQESDQLDVTIAATGLHQFLQVEHVVVRSQEVTRRVYCRNLTP